jgi:hypothetical protein
VCVCVCVRGGRVMVSDRDARLCKDMYVRNTLLKRVAIKQP